MGANLTVPIPMRDFTKLKILECSAIGQQNDWIETCAPTTFEILFFVLNGPIIYNCPFYKYTVNHHITM